MENKKNLLVTLGGKSYINQAKQLFSSVYWNAGWKGDYMLLAPDEIPEKELKWFRDKGILIKKCKPLSDKGWGSWPPTLLDKFYLFTPEFKKWKNIIYLDADIIVRSSLDKLTRVTGINAVSHSETILKNFRNIKSSSEEDITKMIKLLKRGGYDIRKSFFNGGVIVFNTDIIKENTFEQLKKLKQFIDSEERILNIFFYKKWEKLPLMYNIHMNLIGRFHNFSERINEGIVLHFASELPEDKPWYLRHPFYQEWKKNLERAELIDLDNIPEGKKWERNYKNFFYLKFFFLSPITKLIIYLNKIIGEIGLLIKKYNPKLYYKLKQIKDGK